MTGAASIGNGLQAAFMLACGRREGLALLAGPAADDVQVARRSFWAALLCLPALLALHLLDWQVSGAPLHPGLVFAWDLVSYAIGWAGFALASRSIAVRLGRAARWPRFVALWNWCNVVQYLMIVLAGLPGLFGLPDPVSQTAWLVAMGWALWLEWTATRLALDIPPMAAVGLVVFDASLGLFLAGLTAALSGMP